MSTLSHHTEQFLKLSPISHGYREDTIRTYRSWLLALCNHFPADATPADLTRESLLAFSDEMLAKRHYAPASLRNCRAALLMFCKWLMDRGALTGDNPALTLPAPKTPSKPRGIASSVHVAGMYQACNRYKSESRCVLAKAVFCCLAFGGLRSGELMALTLSDIDLATGRLEVRDGKGGKARTVAVGCHTVEALREWLACRPSPSPLKELFLLNPARPLGRTTVQTILEELLAMADIKGVRYTPHAFRHGYTSRIINSGGSVKAVQEQLGHSNYRITIGTYAHTDEETLSEAASLAEAIVASPTAPAPPVPDRPQERTSRRVGIATARSFARR